MYALLADIQALNPKRVYSATSTPTITQVNTYIDFTAGQIDSILLSIGLVGTIDGPTEFVTVLKYLNAAGAGALAEMGMFPETSEMGSTPHWKILQKIYDDGLASLRKGEIPVSLKELLAVGENVGSNYLNAADQGEYPGPVFRKSDADLQF